MAFGKNDSFKTVYGTPTKVGGGPNPAKNVTTSNWQERVAQSMKGGCGHVNCNGSCGMGGMK